MARSLSPAVRLSTGRPGSARGVLVTLVATGGLVLVPVLAPLPAAAEPEPTTSGQAAVLVADRERDLEILTERFNEAREELKATRKAAARAAEALVAAQDDVAQARERVRALARGAYTGERLAALEAMLTSDSPTDLLDRIGTLQSIADHNGGVLGRAEAATAEAEEARVAAERVAADARAQVDRVAAQQADLDREIAAFQAVYERLKGEEERASRAAAERRAAERAAAERRATERPAANSTAPDTGGPDVPDVAPAAPAAPAVPAPVPGGSAAAATAVSTAMAQVGDPYVWAAAGPDAFDCSGLVQYAYAAAGISLPHSSRMQSTMGTPVSRSALQPGDLLFFYSPVSHVGIYIGNGQMVHASTSGSPVKVAPVDYMPSYNSARRIAG
jgi:cell wall-associated NlpC family hydrolase